MEGKRRIMLGSNNYLGFTEDPAVIEAGHKALDKYGTGVSGSRFLNGTLDLHIELEEALARFTGYEAAMTCSTGFQTNLAIISTICGRNDYILNDRENHASIYDACRLSPAQVLRYKHSDMDDLEKKLQHVCCQAKRCTSMWRTHRGLLSSRHPSRLAVLPLLWLPCNNWRKIRNALLA